MLLVTASFLLEGACWLTGVVLLTFASAYSIKFNQLMDVLKLRQLLEHQYIAGLVMVPAAASWHFDVSTNAA